MYRVGIVGAGLIGNKRATVLQGRQDSALVAVCDEDVSRAQEFAKTFSAEIVSSWAELVQRPDIDVVVISVPNKFIVPIALSALEHKKHILCEKPLGRNAKESQLVVDAALRVGRIVKVGFNHRFHPGLAKAKQLFDSGAIGDLLFIRARYGHGGRVGMEQEWRSNPDISGGGELRDQGVHLIDLARWFAGEFSQVYGVTQTKFWPIPVDDNAFVIMKNDLVTVQFHVSTTNWGNIFSFELFGKTGTLVVEGKGGRYGAETLRVGHKKLPFGDLDQTFETFDFDHDTSWQAEWDSFIATLDGKSPIVGGAFDGLAANLLADAIYESNEKNAVIFLNQ